MNKIHNLIILDASGSMGSIKKQAISGFNETVQTIRAAQEKHPDQQHFVTLVVFNSAETKTVYDCAPAAETRDLTPDNYQPDCCTPLFDAMGFSICALLKKVEENDSVLVTIITDGLENHSREFNREAIKAIVDELKGKGWLFTYMGANQDVEKVAMSISIENRISWQANASGTSSMYAKDRKARTRLFDRLAEGAAMDEFRACYFDGID